MLKLRYLLLKNIDPIPYIQQDFSQSTLELLAKPYKDIYSICKNKHIIGTTYLCAIGVLDIDNSHFLSDYFYTLSPDQFLKEYTSILLRNFLKNDQIKLHKVRNQIYDAASRIIIDKGNFEVLNYRLYTQSPVITRVYLQNPELIKKYPCYELNCQTPEQLLNSIYDPLYKNTDFRVIDDVDLLIKYSVAVNKLTLSRAAMIIRDTVQSYSGERILHGTKFVEEVRVNTLKLVENGVNFSGLVIALFTVFGDSLDDQDVYEIAEGMFLAYPDADWNEFTKMEILQDWWRNRQDV